MMEQLQNIFIRPSRHLYAIKDLGSIKITINNRDLIRKDIKLFNKNNNRIQLSAYLFEPLQLTNQIVIYLHCNSGSRIEGLGYLKPIVEHGLPFVIFDFTGSGISEGDFVTLGLNESQDIQIVVNYLKGFNQNMKIALWGRSMGAVASLLYLVQHSKMIQVAVFDSPFSSLKQLALDLGSEQTNLPKFMIQGFMKLFNIRLKQKTGLDLFSKLNLVGIVNKIFTPGLFLGSKNDRLIPFTHIQDLYSKYAGYKQIYYLDQDHHERRKLQTVQFIIKFLKKQFNESQRLHKKSSSNLISYTTGVTGVKRDLKIKMHSYSQVDFRCSLESLKKIDQIKTARREKLNQQGINEISNNKQFIQKGKECQKRKFICLTQSNKRKYESSKMITIQKQMDLKQKQNFEIRVPIKLCKNNRLPLSQIKS